MRSNKRASWCTIFIVPFLSDICTRFISTQAIKSKKKDVLEEGYDKIFKRIGTGYTIVQSDGELSFLNKYFEQKRIILKVKPVGQHAALSENYIRQVKRKIYAYINSNKKSNWSKILQKVTKTVNAVPKMAIGLLKPIDVPNNDIGSEMILDKLKSLHMDVSTINTLEEQKSLYDAFKKKKKNSWLLENEKVFLNLPVKKGIVKERNPKRGAIFVIKKV